MEVANINKTHVDIALEKQRRVSEARAILQDLDRLESIPTEKKRRWVWELLQNAKDCAGENGVSITITLTKDSIVFEHDGFPFDLDSILALVRRTSTKSYDNSDGSTGKFGTGFVTTHVLNKVVEVSGLLQNETGTRPFVLKVDRTANSLEGLQASLDDAFGAINKIYENIQSDEYRSTSFRFELNEITRQIALESIDEFAKNISFTLLINKQINSVTINNHIENVNKTYTVAPDIDVHEDIKFAHIVTGKEQADSDNKNGLIHFTENNITIAVPVYKTDGIYSLKKIGYKARIYKEFPLIGTEKANIPFFVQSERFIPPEQRDGIRTNKSNEKQEDVTADNNREVFVDYKNAVINLFQKLQSAGVENLYLVAESGLPLEKNLYTSREWYEANIQKPLREFYIKQPLLKNVAGNLIALEQAKIPESFIIDEINKSFYSLASKIYPDQFPDTNSFESWQSIISQEPETWPAAVTCTVESLVKDINGTKLKDIFAENNDQQVEWLNRLIGFLQQINRTDLGETYPVYLDQEGNLRRKQELQIDPGLNEKVKSIGNRLGQPVYRQLLHKAIIHKEGISEFDVKGFFDKLNIHIGGLNPTAANKPSFEAVFELVCLFTGTTAKERERWFQLVHELLPEMAPDKVVMDDIADFNWSPAEKASLKYVCWLVENSNTFTAFAETYFQSNTETAFDWLNRLITVLFRNQDYEELIRKYAVIPMQDDSFKKLENYIYCEETDAPFEDLFKNLYRDFTGKGDPRRFLVHPSIINENLPSKSAELIAKPIDELFAAHDADKKVEIDGPLNSLFHQLNEWIGEGKADAELLFPHFSRQRPILYIKAFGPEVSKLVMAIHNLNKPIEEIQALVNLNMTAAELELLQKASLMAGGTQKLLEVAAEMEQQAIEAAWRKKVGNAAEDAFKEAIAEIQAFDVENPDIGYDFEIMLETGELNYFLEIKSTVQFKENIKMSSKQGVTARDNPAKYALCVLARLEANDDVTKEYFIEHAKFLTNVGQLVADKVTGIEQGLNTIQAYKNGEEASSALENEKYAVFVGKKAWATGIPFSEFVTHLKNYFNMQ